MMAFWDDCGCGQSADQARDVDLREASLIWSDEVRGVQGNFLGLIDDHGRTVQFLFESNIPDDVEDASYLRVILMDFPQPERKGSYGRQVTIGDVQHLIETAFIEGADHRLFGTLTFTPW